MWTSPSQTFTGDTLVQSATVAESLEEECVASLLPPPTVPPPVFLCTVEPSSSVNQKSGFIFSDCCQLVTISRFGAITADSVAGGS